MKHLLLFIFIARVSFVVAQPCNQNPETESLWGNKRDGNANPATNTTIFMYNIDNAITSTSYSAFWCEPVGDKYFEIFTDEFDRGYLDNDHWITKMRWNDDCPYSDQNSFIDGSTPPENQSYLSSDNVEVASGHCNLHYYYSPDYNFKLNSSNTCGNVTTPIDLGYTYTASAIFSMWLFPEGRFEIRCKVPSNNYTNPAFWLWWNGGYYNNDWATQEIDVEEFWPLQTGNTYTSYSYPGFSQHYFADNYTYSTSVTTVCSSDLSQGFHKYWVDWNEEYIMWGIDDEIQRIEYRYYCVECNTVQTDCSTEKGFDYAPRIGYPQKMNMPLIADCVPNNLAPLQTFRDQPMMIDYMKYYKRVDCNESVYVTEFNSSRHVNPSPRAYAGEKVYISGYNSVNSSYNHILVPNGENLNIGATDIIDIQNDFEAEEGSFFEARVKPCNTLIDVVAAKNDETTQQKKTKNVFSANIYPNPTTNSFNIAVNNLLLGGIEIEILNYVSSTVYRNYFAENAGNSLLKISDLNLPSGIYFVKISNGGNRSLRRLVITN